MRSLRATFCALFITAVSACSSLQTHEPDAPDLSITDAPIELELESDVNTTTYRAVTFTNNTGSAVTINNLAFTGNDCGAYSVFHITDAGGNIKYQAGDAVDVGLSDGASADIILRFSPTSCETKEYTTTFIIYHTDGATQRGQTVLLHTTVNDATVNIVCAEKPDMDYNDDIGDPTPSRKLPSGVQYYLMVERMRAFIQPTGGFTSMATRVGTDINLAEIAEEDLFAPVYLPLTTDDNGNVYLDPIDECDGFALPSPVSDTYFWGAQVILTTAAVSTGAVERIDPLRIGEVTFTDFAVRLYSNINNGASLIQDETGNFGINIITDLTTAESATNTYLADVADEVDDDGEPFLNLMADGENSVLVGTNLYHGTASFVGVGLFEGADAMLSGEARSALIDNEAYLFIQIDAKVVTAKESE